MDSASSNRVRVVSPPAPPQGGTMGIFTYVKIGLAVAVFVVLGFLVWNYHHMKSVIADQQAQIANLKVEQEVQAKKQAAFDAFMAKRPVIQRRVQNEKAQIDKEVGTADDAGLRALYDRYRTSGVRQDTQVRPPANGKRSRAKPASGGPAGAP